jgi:MFS family permease
MNRRASLSPSPRRWLTGTVFGFGLASLLSDMGHEAATAALPALLALLGAAPAALGIIEGVSDGLVTFAKLAGGFWADRARLRKPICVGGYLATGIATGLFAIASTWGQVLAARSIAWLARGVRGPARDAMLADAVPEEATGRAFGFHRAMDTAGAVIGPALAAVLIHVAPVRHVFTYALVPGVLAAVVFALLVHRQPPRLHERPQPFWRSVRGLPASFRRFLVAAFMFGLGDFARSLLILRAMQLLTPALGATRAATTAIALYVVHNVAYAIAAYPIGHLADIVEPRLLLAVGYLLGTSTAVLAAVATPSMPVLVALFAVAGLVLAFADTLEGTITAKLVQPALRGTAFGVLAATNGVGDLVSSVLVGVLWSAFGARAAFGCAAILCLAGVLGLGLAPRDRPSRSRS